MEKSIKFLGIMILISSIVISLGGIIENMYFDRYKIIRNDDGDSYIFDSLKGISYDSGINIDNFKIYLSFGYIWKSNL